MSSGGEESNLFETQSKIVLNCGNIASWSKIKKKVLLTSTGEIVSAIENTLISYFGSQKQHPTSDQVPIIRSAGLAQTISPEERDSLNITLKIFPFNWDPALVTRAMNISIAELGLESVDTVILSFPLCPAHELTLDKLQLLWKAVEGAARKGKMSTIGVADLDKDMLQKLFEWATVKPRINQINLAHCCTIPEDLAVYCKESNITLYTHNDERCILPVGELQDTISTTLKMGGDSWGYNWASRYNSVIKLRGIVSHKGYLVELNRN